MIPEQAILAMTELDGTVFQGRIIHVLPARPHASAVDASSGAITDPTGTGKPQTYKEQQEAERKKRATTGQEDNVWNTLLIRTDTAVAAVAEQYGITTVCKVGRGAVDGGTNRLCDSCIGGTEWVDVPD